MTRLIRSSTVTLALLFALTACGGSTTKSGEGAKSPQTPSSSETTKEPASDKPAGSPTLADGEAPAANTITITKNGFDPHSLEIAEGEKVTFKAGSDGVFAVNYGEGSDSATVTGGLIETFSFPGPGTYTFSDSLTGIPMTVTVK